jgi:hypothetical protein
MQQQYLTGFDGGSEVTAVEMAFDSGRSGLRQQALTFYGGNGGRGEN